MIDECVSPISPLYFLKYVEVLSVAHIIVFLSAKPCEVLQNKVRRELFQHSNRLPS